MEIPFGTQEEQLETVNKAIYTILVGGQSYKIGSRNTGLLGDTSVAFFDGR